MLVIWLFLFVYGLFCGLVDGVVGFVGIFYLFVVLCFVGVGGCRGFLGGE